MKTELQRPTGVIVPVATPLDSVGELNVTALRELLRAQIPVVDGIFVLGSSGELTWMTDESAKEVRRIGREETEGRVPLYVGVGDTSLPRTLARVRALGADDADFIVVTTPFYYPVEQNAIIDFFTTVADTSAIPVVLYNIPQNTGLVLETETVRVLAQHKNIVGVKDSSGDMFGFLRMLALKGPEFSVLQGREQLLMTSFAAGADGIVSALGNIAPQLLRAVIDATVDREDVLALELQAKITSIASLFDQGYWISALKSALNTLGFNVGAPVDPMPSCTLEESAAVALILDSTDGRWLLGRMADQRG